MTRIDRYLAFLYIRVFLVCFLTLAGLLMVAQIFTNLDEFIQYGKIRGNLLLALAEYFGPVMLNIFEQTCGLLTLLAMLFVIAWLYRTNELTAMLAAGISKARILRVLLCLSLLAIVLGVVTREFWIPQWSHILTKKPQDLQGTERVLPIRPTEDRDQGMLIAGRNLVNNTQSIQSPVFRLFGPASKLATQINGDNARYLEATEEHRAGYLVEGVLDRELLLKGSVQFEGIDYIRLPSDTPWLKPTECFLPSMVEFDMLRGGTAKQFASTADLLWRLKHQSEYYGDDLKLLIHRRFVQPWLDLTQLLLGLPFVLTTRNRNVIQLSIACLITFGIYYAVNTGFGVLGSSSVWISPSFAAWAPLLLFAPIAYARAMRALIE
jgi:lipopolysaccharide export system permease protein